MSVLPSPAGSSAPAAGLDPLVVRHLATALRPGAVAADAAEVRVRGTVRVGPAWLPLRAVGTVAPRAGYLVRVRVLGMTHLVEEQRAEDDDGGAGRHASTLRALAALWVPGALRPETGASWERLDATHLRVTADDLDLRVHVHPHGHVLGVRTQGWGDPYRIGHPRWAEIGYEVHEWRTFGSVRVPATVAVGWYPGRPYGREIARLRLVSWEPRSAEAVR